MVLRKGEKVFQGNVKKALSSQVRIVVSSDDLEKLKNDLSGFDGLSDVEKEDELLLLSAKEGVTLRDVSQYLFDKKNVLTHLSKREGSLEQQFLNILGLCLGYYIGRIVWKLDSKFFEK